MVKYENLLYLDRFTSVKYPRRAILSKENDLLEVKNMRKAVFPVFILALSAALLTGCRSGNNGNVSTTAPTAATVPATQATQPTQSTQATQATTATENTTAPSATDSTTTTETGGSQNETDASGRRMPGQYNSAAKR